MHTQHTYKRQLAQRQAKAIAISRPSTDRSTEGARAALMLNSLLIGSLALLSLLLLGAGRLIGP